MERIVCVRHRTHQLKDQKLDPARGCGEIERPPRVPHVQHRDRDVFAAAHDFNKDILALPDIQRIAIAPLGRQHSVDQRPALAGIEADRLAILGMSPGCKNDQGKC